MLGDFITRFLVLLFGYAYPAFECFKSVEKNNVDIEEIRFWCQYWIIIALVTVCERIGDIFLSWLPMYGEVKLAFFIYLWHPKTKGTGYIYDTLLRPLVARHETDIERKLQETKARGWDFAIYYWNICAELGQTKFFEALQYLARQSGKFTNDNSEKSNGDEPSATSPNELPSLAKNTSENSKSPPRPPTPPGSSTINREVAGSPKSKRVQVHLNEETESVTAMDTNNSTDLDSNVNEKLHQFRMRLRRSKPMQQ
ncbi:PREDICTED: putative HVA22-like protein g [Populus euphratica]|uniref:HVA22-like protein n=1 Tax=Populus euphratica TaxID=75702 RepID=A0AAJ6Y8Z0_POPEU|nr:PREDICTED: putative HVA22-like protein g [Populus euphratica]XP_011046885.1 PREDICTED: putative HVA22-like protein g [Populus euphratica]XP_011046886.1 PREDICTED: putative HVA22-like protein g [Populus euphratica]XP_011046887.1 PREDICTED: putative HVA22-like protein g [Populus euphratica]